MHNERRVFVLAAAAILFYQLILPPVIGIGDNGDFAKIIRRFDLVQNTDTIAWFAQTTYHFDSAKRWVS